MPGYDTGAIRKLLSSAFNDDEFGMFCFDHFPAVHRSFSSAMGLLVKIQHLLDYCGRFGELEKLLRLEDDHDLG